MNPSETTGEADVQDGDAGLYWVAPFLIDLVFGGHEEGGWHYQAGTLVVDPDVYQTLGCGPAGFPEVEAASLHATRMRESLPVLSQGRPDITSVLSIGVYEVRVMRALVLPTRFPKTPPRYE